MNANSFATQLAEDLSAEDLRLVLGVFEADVTRLTRALDAAAQAADAGGFRRAAHGLAGAAGAVGATDLETACRLAMESPETAPAALAQALAEIRILGAQALAEVARLTGRLDSAR